MGTVGPVGTVGTVETVGTIGPVGPVALVLPILQFWLTLLAVLVILAIQLFYHSIEIHLPEQQQFPPLILVICFHHLPELLDHRMLTKVHSLVGYHSFDFHLINLPCWASHNLLELGWGEAF